MRANETVVKRPEQPEGLPYDMAEDELSIKDSLLAVWKKRVLFLVWTLTLTMVVLSIAAFTYFIQDRYSLDSLVFRITFDGVEKNQYPNGTPFSTSDILAGPIVKSVYEANNLESFLKLSEFRASLAVVQTNDKLVFLEKEYAARLDDRKITIEQRRRIEDEFTERKKALMAPVFRLVMTSKGKAGSIPEALRTKVLNDILVAWAEYADKVKGANKYDIPIVSENILNKRELDTEDFLVVIDMIKNTVSRILGDIENVRKIPGASTFRLDDSKVSLFDIKYRVEDLDRFKISPLLGVIRLGGITKNEELTKVYLHHRIFELKMKQDDALAREKIYETSLQKYFQTGSTAIGTLGTEMQGRAEGAGQGVGGVNVPATIPQLGETFLNSIIRMAQENLDAKFRQEIAKNIVKEGLDRVAIQSELKYYEAIVAELGHKSESDREAGQKELIRSKVVNTISDVYETLIRSIREVNSIYKGISIANLNPSSVLYGIVEPATSYQVESTPLRRVGLYAGMAWVVLEGFLFIALLIAGSRGRKSA